MGDGADGADGAAAAAAAEVILLVHRAEESAERLAGCVARGDDSGARWEADSLLETLEEITYLVKAARP